MESMRYDLSCGLDESAYRLFVILLRMCVRGAWIDDLEHFKH